MIRLYLFKTFGSLLLTLKGRLRAWKLFCEAEPRLRSWILPCAAPPAIYALAWLVKLTKYRRAMNRNILYTFYMINRHNEAPSLPRKQVKTKAGGVYLKKPIFLNELKYNVFFYLPRFANSPPKPYHFKPRPFGVVFFISRSGVWGSHAFFARDVIQYVFAELTEDVVAGRSPDDGWRSRLAGDGVSVFCGDCSGGGDWLRGLPHNRAFEANDEQKRGCGRRQDEARLGPAVAATRD